jgi:hypothetical protein
MQVLLGAMTFFFCCCIWLSVPVTVGYNPGQPVGKGRKKRKERKKKTLVLTLGSPPEKGKKKKKKKKKKTPRFQDLGFGTWTHGQTSELIY